MKTVNLYIDPDTKDKAAVVMSFKLQALKERWSDKEISSVIMLTYGKTYKETLTILRQYCKLK